MACGLPDVELWLAVWAGAAGGFLLGFLLAALIRGSDGRDPG